MARGRVAFDQTPQALRLGAIGAEGFGIEKIEAERFGIVRLGPERFAGSARPEEEEAAGSRSEKSKNNFHFETQYGVWNPIVQEGLMQSCVVWIG